MAKTATDTDTKVKRGSSKSLSDGHKAAMEHGRKTGRIVKAYLEMLESVKSASRRGRKTDYKARIAESTATINDPLCSPVERVNAIQRRMDLNHGRQAQNNRAGNVKELAKLQEAFVAVLPGYSKDHGISYAAWREIGVDAITLKDAGISRTGLVNGDDIG